MFCEKKVTLRKKKICRSLDKQLLPTKHLSMEFEPRPLAV